MASTSKTYSCKYCEVDGLIRKEFIKHTKTKKHKIIKNNRINLEKNVLNTKCALKSSIIKPVGKATKKIDSELKWALSTGNLRTINKINKAIKE